MSTEAIREEAAGAIRDLNHTFAMHDPHDAQLQTVTREVQALVAQLGQAPRRDRLALMRAGITAGAVPMSTGTGFSDRAVGGSTNPTSADIITVDFGAEIVATVVLRRAFEGAPGRAHGGMVAAVFDDVTGYVIGQLREPAFTGELTVRYLAPVPVDEPLEMRARLDGRERRKLFISGEVRHGDHVVATCKAIYITVDPTKFAGFPDPR